MDKYITIRSTDSTSYFPDNKPWSFRVNLYDRLYFGKKWAIAVTEIIVQNWEVSKKSDCHDIYVYSNICHSSHVGERKEPLLRCICLRGNKRDRLFVFPQCRYIPLKLEDLQIVDIYIQDADGNPASFITGPVTVTLHLKPQPFWF